MKDPLFLIVENLKKEEIRNFKIYVKRFKRAEDIKMLNLFDLIRANEYNNDENELVAKIFVDNPGNTNAYHHLKYRLKTELEKSLLNLHFSLDEKISINHLITLSSIFNYKAQYEVSLYYLKKAEKIAVQNEYYDLLDFIYNDFINLSFNLPMINPLVYIERKKKNTNRNIMMMKANHDLAAIRYKLHKSNISKASEDIANTLNKTMKELNIAKEIYDLPNVKLNIHFCIRNLLLQNNDIEGLEKYMLQSLKEFEQIGFFNKNTHKNKIIMITWIVNALMMNKKWDEALKQTEILHEEIQKYNRLHYDNYIWPYHQSVISSYIASNRLEEAIALIEELKGSNIKGVKFYDYDIHCNLSQCYHYTYKYSHAIKALSNLLTKEIYPKLSAEMQFSLSVFEVVLHIDNNNLEYASYRLKEIRRLLRTLLKRADYQEDSEFLRLLSNIVNLPSPFKNDKVLDAISQFISKATIAQVGSNKYVDYVMWLRSKLERKPYYDLVLETFKKSNS